jgi:lysophospholipase L1-like esterase
VKLLAVLIVLFAAALAVRSGFAQQASKPATTDPAAAGAKPAEDFMTARNRQLLNDFGGLARFKDANAKLAAPAAGENRIVFMGDSITEGWHLDQSFPARPYINRGISGQTTPQMLLRFRQDVIDLHPKAVVILAGTNDVAGNTGPMTPEETEGNIKSMAELASSNGIRVVLCSIPPARAFPWRPTVQPVEAILAINAWIKGYAAEKGYPYVDYHTAAKDADNGLPLNLSKDGVHPNAAGYAVMAPLVEVGITKALAQ